MLVWLAVMLVVLLALAGFSVDFWHWNSEGSRIQKAADAAALGGAVFMPENVGNQAFTMAKAVATKNGFDDVDSDVAVQVSAGLRPNQLKVRITKTVNNFFGSMVGVDSTTIVKSAVGEYQRAVNMGSPANYYGNDPELGTNGTPSYPFFWASIAGPSTDKVQGDAMHSTTCGTNANGTRPDNCPSTTNTEYDSKGYFYGIEVANGASGPMALEAFDPAFVEVGGTCGNSTNGSNLSGAAALTPAQIPGYPGTVPPATRFSPAAPSATARYCTGDQSYTTSTYTPPWTTYTVLAPDDSPWDPTDNPPVSGCTKDFSGYRDDIRAALVNASAVVTTDGDPKRFSEYFRQWYRICSVSAPEAGTYFVQVRTATKADGTAAPSAGHGQNRFAMRVGMGGSYATTQARIYGEARMSMYSNVPNANATFYLARILPGAPGRSLVLAFFDIGDANGAGGGTLRVVPPTDANVSAFTGCTYTRPPGTATGPPWGTFQSTGSNCQITSIVPGGTNGFDGQWVQLRIPIPDDYDCDIEEPLGCWARIEFSFTNTVTDTTTWVARIEGDPVRLVE